MNTGYLIMRVIRSLRSQTRIILLFLMLYMAGCSYGVVPKTTVPFPGFEETLGISRIQNGLSIKPVETQSPQEEKGIINLLIENRSGDKIAFLPGYGSRLFGFNVSTGSWEEISNRAQYVGDGDILTGKATDASNWAALLSVSPDIQESGRFNILRIAIVGTIQGQGGPDAQRVGSYVDIQLDSR